MTVSPIAQGLVRVLLVEDNIADVDLIRDALDDVALDPSLSGAAFELETVDRLRAGMERLLAGDIDVVLLDLSLPDSHGLDTFVRLERTAPTTPIVVLSGLDDEQMAVRAVREGAQDYLVKGRADSLTLSRSIRYAVERKRAEDERARLARAQAEAEASLRSRDETLATISHDLRTPLTSIRGVAQLLQRRIARAGALDPVEVLERLGRIEEQTVLMARMIDDLLDVARIEAGRPLELHLEDCELIGLVERAAADVQRTTDLHDLRVESGVDGPLTGLLDAVRIERVIQNLLTNAVKYSPAGGEVTVILSRDEDAGGAWAVIAVRDQGIGIPPEDVPHIFERFYRASNVGDGIRGTGLGLAGAQQIVQQHGGEISAASEPGQGTTITVRLPAE
ncbi:MAG: response regulator [Chloroflexi bacterium]|nr:response regulator [Chloroflexota bacterium]